MPSNMTEAMALFRDAYVLADVEIFASKTSERFFFLMPRQMSSAVLPLLPGSNGSSNLQLPSAPEISRSHGRLKTLNRSFAA